MSRRPILRPGEFELPVHSVRDSEIELDRLGLQRGNPADFYEVELPEAMQAERFEGLANRFGDKASHIHISGNNCGYGAPKYRMDVIGEDLADGTPEVYRLRSYMLFPGAFLLGKATLQTIDAELVNDHRRHQTPGGELPRAQDIDDLHFLARALVKQPRR